jgi:hypothetical protein
VSILSKPFNRVASTAVFATVFVLFYLKYVPLVPGYQALVLGSGLAVLVLGAARPRAGTLAFIFAFPLVNAWPYFFGIDESVPHAPAALVLFLFFALGRLAGRSFGSLSSPGPAPDRIRSPMLFFAGLTSVSAAITLWRFAGFFPFVAERLYEYPINVNGVSAGGARMSVLFAALNLLSGMGFFVLVHPELRDARFRMKALAAAAAALLVASGTGLAQRLFNPEFGNTEFWSNMGQVNGTFKDPNAFGAVLSLFIPLLIAAFFFEKGSRRWLFGAAALISLAAFPFIGARSPLVGLAAALVWFALSATRAWRRSGGRIGRAALAGIVLAIAVLAGLGVVAAGKSRLFDRLTANISGFTRGRGLVDISPERYFLWREALAMMRDYPASGVGIGAYIVELPNYYSSEASHSAPVPEGWKRIDSAENLPLQFGAELGLAGIFAMFWLAAAFVALCRRTLRTGGRESGSRLPDRLLLVAAAAGLLAFALNALFHSYIGSFETAYSFWFLAAYLSAADASAPAPLAGKRRVPIFAALGVLAFAAVLAWDAGHSLSPGSRWKTYPIPREFGLFSEEKTADGRAFRWTRAYGAFPLPDNAVRISVPIHAAHPDIASRPVDVELTLVEGFFRSKVSLGRIRLGDDAWRTVDVPLPSRHGSGAFLLVTVSRTWIPLKVTGAPDPRELGVAVGPLAFR